MPNEFRRAAKAAARGPLATPDEIAEYLGVPVKTLYQWKCRGIGPISPTRPDLTQDPDLPDEWWELLRHALDRLASAEGVKETVRDTWIDRAFPQFLGIPAPAKIERVTGHGDLHWGNITGPPLTLLDWERWGRVPVGYDPGLLHANSLLVPNVAERVRSEFSSVLATPGGRIGELCALAEMLQAVARGHYPQLAPYLLDRSEDLTGVRPPVSAPAEITA
ncbi:hypothetical protein [Streptomyces sp. RKND-216]|uniref:hypothetical protein n=1 Tax=Streptomyces sp. RKND-216 TaxID=2562581 RepID=UPI001FF7590C|nr:hypothetical protein [Streptomyces sp. RKND-216]